MAAPVRSDFLDCAQGIPVARFLRRVARQIFLDAPYVLALGWTAQRLIKSHLHYILPTPVWIGGDEGYIAAFGQRMVEGHMLPFVDAVSHRGPLLYWIEAIFAKVFGMGWLPIRLTSLVVQLSTIVFAFVAGWRARHKLAGATAALATAFGYAAVLQSWDGLSYNGEHASNLFIMASFFFLVCALDAKGRPGSISPWLLALAACAATLSALCKQVSAIAFIPMLLWSFAAILSRPGLTTRGRVKLALTFLGASTVPLLVTAARYAAAGELRTLAYWTLTYNAKIYMAPFPLDKQINDTRAWLFDNKLLLVTWLPLLLWCAVRGIAGSTRVEDVARNYDKDGFMATVALQGLLGIVSGHAAMREFSHYYAVVFPWAGFVIGAIVESLGRGTTALGRLVPAAVVLLPAIGITQLGAEECLKMRNPADLAKDSDEVCAFVHEHSKADEPIFIWGWGANSYISCKRKAASRFVYTTMVSGFIPASGVNDDKYAVPGTRELLLKELEESRPPLILIANVYGIRSMHDHPIFEEYLVRNYCPAGKPGGVEAMLRRHDGEDCPPPE